MDEDSVHEPHERAVVSVNRSILVLSLFLSLIMGVIGGAGSLYILSNNPNAKNILGDTASLTLPVRQKVVLEENSKFIDVAKQANPAVVAIATSRDVTDFFGQVYQSKGGGTGFIISNDGLIATNKHVVSDTGAQYKVILNDGTSYDATVKSLDPFFDFAVVKIDAKNLKTLDFGDSNALQVGQWVMAIGNALAQFQNTVTAGIVSAKERSITAGDAGGTRTESLEGLIQTDAAINLGNSGGPLLNLSGQVVGVNTATAEAQNIGFAIPINVLKPAIDSVVKTGKIVRPALGVRYIPMTKQIAENRKLPVDHGAYVQPGQNGEPGVVSGTAADKSGIKEGDVISKINGQDVDENHSLSTLVQQYSVGQKIKITYWRDGKENTTEVTLDEFKQ